MFHNQVLSICILYCYGIKSIGKGGAENFILGKVSVVCVQACRCIIYDLEEPSLSFWGKNADLEGNLGENLRKELHL